MSFSGKKILVTGAAGFIGYHLTKRLLQEGHEVTGVDNLNTYYDVTLKEARLKQIRDLAGFTFVKEDLHNAEAIKKVFSGGHFEVVVNLAAQAGVRYSLVNPAAYIDSNITGFLNILEGCRHYGVKNLIYASSSSVYGANTKMPFSIHDNVNHPISLYAATKKSNELMAHTYSSLFQIPTTGLRFFTVYGPWGRPDMALFLFTKAIIEGTPIDVFNFGKMKRDFTYIDDIVEGVARLVHLPAAPNAEWSGTTPDPSSSYAPYKIYNIGNNRPVELLKFIEVLEENIGKKAVKNFLPIQQGDVEATFADINDLMNDVGYKPATSIETGIKNFVEWYKSFYSKR